MNKARRKRLDEIYSKLEGLRSDLGSIRDEEQDAYDNLPESMQAGERGEKMQEAINEMENADTSIDDALNSIDTAKAE